MPMNPDLDPAGAHDVAGSGAWRWNDDAFAGAGASDRRAVQATGDECGPRWSDAPAEELP